LSYQQTDLEPVTISDSKRTGPYLYPRTAYNVCIFLEIFSQGVKFLITVVKTILKNDGGDHIAWNTGQKKARITGRSYRTMEVRN
jgi:hypothetical protein